jgi:hypothetical protein
MGSRGRKSVEAMMLMEGGLVAIPPPPDAPYDLTDEQAEEWRKIVNCMPPGYFIPAHFPVFAQLCRHIDASHKVANLLRSFSQRSKKRESLNLRIYIDLLRQQAAESPSIARLSRALRLTHQATLDQKVRLPKNRGGPKPWDREEDD